MEIFLSLCWWRTAPADSIMSIVSLKYHPHPLPSLSFSFSIISFISIYPFKSLFWIYYGNLPLPLLISHYTRLNHINCVVKSILLLILLVSAAFFEFEFPECVFWLWKLKNTKQIWKNYEKYELCLRSAVKIDIRLDALLFLHLWITDLWIYMYEFYKYQLLMWK